MNLKIIKSKEALVYATYKNELYEIIDPPGEISALKKSVPKTQITIKTGNKTETVSLGDVRLDGE